MRRADYGYGNYDGGYGGGRSGSRGKGTKSVAIVHHSCLILIFVLPKDNNPLLKRTLQLKEFILMSQSCP